MNYKKMLYENALNTNLNMDSARHIASDYLTEVQTQRSTCPKCGGIMYRDWLEYDTLGVYPMWKCSDCGYIERVSEDD